MRISRVLAVLLVFLAGCASPAVHYYSLVPAAEAAPGPAAVAALRGRDAVRLRVTQIPAQTDRPQVLVQDPSAGPAVQVLNDSLWAAPLADEMQAALADQVSRQLGLPGLERLPDAAERAVRRIDVQITRFDLTWGEAVHLSANWTDHAPRTAVRLCQARLALPAGRSVASLVESARGALRSLALLITHPGSAPAAAGIEGVLESGCT